MKALLKKLFIAGIAVLFATGVNAQKKGKRISDYVITPKGDTVACVIIIPFLGKDTYTPMDDDPQPLKPEDIKGYYLRSKNAYFQSVYRPNEKKPVFLKALETGKINLYEDTVANNVTDSYKAVWYIAKGNGKIVELKRSKIAPAKPGKSPKNELEEMLMDNKNVYDVYTHDKVFTFDEARSFIHFYNTGVWQQGWVQVYPH